MKAQNFEILPAHSSIAWIGRKVTGAHDGTIAIKNGNLLLENGNLIKGQVVVDTRSIVILDVSDPATNAQFAGHLSSEDFFGSAEHPEALLNILTVKGNLVEGDLTIKGITQPIAFEANIQHTGDSLMATGKIIIDRTKYGMRFRSGNFFKDLGDTLIYNDFELQVSITAKAVPAIA